MKTFQELAKVITVGWGMKDSHMYRKELEGHFNTHKIDKETQCQILFLAGIFSNVNRLKETVSATAEFPNRINLIKALGTFKQYVAEIDPPSRSSTCLTPSRPSPPSDGSWPRTPSAPGRRSRTGPGDRPSSRRP